MKLQFDTLRDAVEYLFRQVDEGVKNDNRQEQVLKEYREAIIVLQAKVARLEQRADG